MKKLILIVLVCLIYTSSFAAETIKTDEQKTLYVLGQIIARQLSVFTLSPSELELVKQGLADGIAGKPSEVEINVYGPKIQQLAESRRKVQGEKQASLGKEFLDKTAKEKGAVKTESGMVYLAVKEGTGATPNATDNVKVNYRGTLINGTEFDSSYKRGEPIEFKLDGVIKCWTEGLQKMKVGGKSKFVCPSTLAYGDKGSGGIIPPGATLVFEVELLDIKK